MPAGGGFRMTEGGALPPEALAEGVGKHTGRLPVQLVHRMLTEARFQPGSRPSHFEAGCGRWVFKEQSADKRRRGTSQDRWKHSGGKKGARNLAVMADGEPLVRRRYGNVIHSGTKTAAFRYHSYTLLDVAAAAGNAEPSEVEHTPTVYHVLPIGGASGTAGEGQQRRGGRGRGRGTAAAAANPRGWALTLPPPDAVARARRHAASGGGTSGGSSGCDSDASFERMGREMLNIKEDVGSVLVSALGLLLVSESALRTPAKPLAALGPPRLCGPRYHRVV